LIIWWQHLFDLAFERGMPSDQRTVYTVAGCVFVGVAFMNWIFWLYRVSAFRKDRPLGGGDLGEPFDLNWEILDPSRYRPEGKRAYAIFVASTLALWIGGAVTAFLAWL
jgi:hypothetical protein